MQLHSKADFYSQYIKGSLALRGKEPKKTIAKKGTVVAALKKVFTFSRSYDLPILTIINLEQEEEASSTSSSSEEGLLCVFSDSETSSEEKVVKSSSQSNTDCSRTSY